MAYQSPLISIPRKTTQDVDWSTPIRSVIAGSYGENPGSYSEECSVLSRCRQDAVKGAGSDATARDLLYKYFGQLELLELRFAEIKVPFNWIDAFTLKATTQTSLAFEKASIIHLLGAVLSSLASGGSRADGEGIKRAYYNSRAAAGMLTYINENFLHAPSTDLSREVVHLLIGIMMAQATEIFTEKLVSEKKAPGLVCRSANQAAGMYNTLVDEMKEFQGKGILDRSWLYVLQIKAKLFASIAQYYRSTADTAAGKHGSGVARMKLADSLAQEAQRQANSFSYAFVSSATPTLPHDAATSLMEITKAHASLCSEAKNQIVKDNDLIYHDILPSEASLPSMEKLPPAAPITIQDVYGNPEVSKLIGPDIFVRLVPLAVHESASVYSEEKAKLVRAEVERVDMNEGEIRASLEHMGVPGVLSSWRRLADDDEDGGGGVEISGQLRRLAEDIQSGGSIDNLLRDLDNQRNKCQQDLQNLSRMLSDESRECEKMRAEYAPQFTQAPSGSQTSHFRSNITQNLDSLNAAAASDQQITSLWRDIQPQIGALAAGEQSLQQTAQQIASGKQAALSDPTLSLLDLQEEDTPKSGLDSTEKETLLSAVKEGQDKVDRLSKIRRERDDVLKDLKEKIQNDDVSSLLLLNRRSQNVEPQLFASELEKFRPYQGRISAAIGAAQNILQELEGIIQRTEKGKGVRERQKGQRDQQRRLRDWERGLLDIGEKYSEVRAGAGKGLSYYESLRVVIDEMEREVRSFVSSRDSERGRMVSDIQTRRRMGGSTSPAGATSGLESSLAGMSMGQRSTFTSPPPPPKPGYPTPPAVPTPPAHTSTPGYLPPPPHQQSKSSNPYDFGNSNNLPSAFSNSYSAPSQPSQPSYPSTSTYGSSSSYAPPSNPQSPTNPYPPPPPSRPSQTTYQPPQPSPYPPPPPQRQTSGSYYPSSQHVSSPPPQLYQNQYQHPSQPPPHQYQQQSPPPQTQQYPPYAPPPQQQQPQQHHYPQQQQQPQYGQGYQQGGYQYR